ncbi:hypothetical protein L5515_019325 [Caenorhabditis briggsae]|uniref:Uncharacterized protein n=1 Tax=Caenorhabditis briggsae TaxID=6238 RepID=A0AAE9FIP3_CAEBR|nr:hypothetical protein L5515_019325 [Caenorhabditis briggsae]
MNLIVILLFFGTCSMAPIDLSVQETSELLAMMDNKGNSQTSQLSTNNTTTVESITFNPIDFCSPKTQCFSWPQQCTSDCQILYGINNEFKTSSVFLKNMRSWEHVELMAGADLNNFEDIFIVFPTNSFGMNARHLDGGLIQVNSSEAFRVSGERQLTKKGGILWTFETVVVKKEGKNKLFWQTATIGEEQPHNFQELYPFGGQEVEQL